MRTRPPHATENYQDGRDELNLADFPISVLQRQQPLDGGGQKRDTAVYEASRYDRAARRRVRQRVILETSSRHGLPTPADENVILALLHVAKHTHNFREPVVPFAPRQLFRIMGWAPNSRSYDRLRQVLRRLKALVIRYENSWWDIAGRGYEAEVATGVISEYELGRQVSGRRKGGAAPPCWVCWTPRFQQSLASGNLKKLDLERLFALRLPTAQRMYRFLDKRFYPPQQPPAVEMDLIDFACGHVGLSRVGNVAELKRRLAPAIAELESIGFIAKAEPAQRYQKVKPGVWRVRFQAGPAVGVARGAGAQAHGLQPVGSRPTLTAEQALVAEFYRLWGGEAPHVGERDLEQARTLIERHGADAARGLVPELVRVVKRSWPACKSFSGAAAKYGAEAAQGYAQRLRAGAHAHEAKALREQERAAAARQAEQRRQLETRWESLPARERADIERRLLESHPELGGRPGILKMLCLDELASRAADEKQAGGRRP
jgi:hypothetical protein